MLCCVFAVCLQIAARLGGEAALLASVTSQAGSQKLVEQMQKVRANITSPHALADPVRRTINTHDNRSSTKPQEGRNLAGQMKPVRAAALQNAGVCGESADHRTWSKG